jgi:hypothetical protein
MRTTKRIFLAALLLAAALVSRVDAQTVMLKGSPAAVTGATNANPPVVSFASGALGATSANDWVYVAGVGGNTAVNGVWPCSSVSATSCTLQGPVGNGAFTSGGTIQLLGAVGNGSSDWFDCSACIKSAVYVFSNGSSSAIVTLEGTSSKAASVRTEPSGLINPVITTPASVLRSITNPDNGAAGNGYITPATNVNFLRVTVSSWVSGTMYAVVTCQKADGSRVQ